MPGFALSARDLVRMTHLHPDLKKVVIEAAKISAVKFTVLQADRTIKQQQANVKAGVSTTMHSRHLIDHAGLVYAVDVAPIGPGGAASFAWPLYFKLEPFMKQAAKNCGVPVEWGGDWHTFKDGPHWQLPWDKYPAK